MSIEAPEQGPVSQPLDPVSPPQPAAAQTSAAQKIWGRARKADWRILTGLAVVLFSIPLWRAVTNNARAREPRLPVIPAQPVAVAKVTRENLAQELVCDGELRPYQEIDLHAKVAGYLQTMTVDIGDHVEAGQLLATIEIPELQDDLAAAKARGERSQQEVARTQAAYDETHLVFTRISDVMKATPNLIAQQELDDARAKDLAAASALAAAKAQVQIAAAETSKLETMLKYSRITAPFAGVITRRFADPGALIQAGTSSSTQSLPLVCLSENDRLRLDIPVSVSYVARINNGDPVEITIESLDQVMTGKVARSTRKVDTATRTMEVEVDIPNPDLKLIPGMYASAKLQLQHRDKTLVVPVEAVSRQKSCTVLVVNAHNQIEQRTVQLGMETPQKVEVLSGLKENELVLIGSRTEFKPGQLVEPRLIAANIAP
jgi:RND family efflux transporter MFP subunit